MTTRPERDSLTTSPPIGGNDSMSKNLDKGSESVRLIQKVRNNKTKDTKKQIVLLKSCDK